MSQTIYTIFLSLAVCLQVSCIGQMLCAVVADTRAHAKRGAAAVKISYEDLPDPVFTTEVCRVKRIKQIQHKMPFFLGCTTTSDLDLII